MKRILVVVVCWAFSFLSPLAARATDVEYPSLGIKLTNLPNNAKGLGVQERLKEDQVQILFGGNTSALISRLDEPVPQGDIADKGYRDALLKQLGIHPRGGALPMVLIASQPAWGTGYAQHFGPLTAYRCAFYLVVGGHLYEIAVSAVGEGQPTQASFDTAAREVTSGLVFEPVQPLPEKPLAPGEMPRFLMGSAVEDYYPNRERRLGEQGVVDVEFSIDGQGVAQGVKVTNRANRNFSGVAVTMLKSGGFKIPRGWEQTGGPKRSFTMEIRFGLNCPTTFPPSNLPDAQVITICGTTPGTSPHG
jgi:TonB family protein